MFAFEEDERFHLCAQDCLRTYIFYFCFFVATMLTLYLLGDHFVLGMPLWFLVSAIVVPIVFIIVLIFMVEKNVFRDFDLDPYIEEETKDDTANEGSDR